MNKKLYTKDQIIKKLSKKYGSGNVCIVSTEGYDLTTNCKRRNSNKDRSKWADTVVAQLYNGMIRSEIIQKNSRVQSTGEYNFAYVKFACDDDGNVYGIVSGLSSFHKMYPSDVYFYNLEKAEKKEAAKRMKENALKWYTKEILIVKNVNELDRKESAKHEKEIKELFGLSD